MKKLKQVIDNMAARANEPGMSQLHREALRSQVEGCRAELDAHDAVVEAARKTLGGLDKLRPGDYLTAADMFNGELLIDALAALDKARGVE